MIEAVKCLEDYDTQTRHQATVLSSERITPEASDEEVRELVLGPFSGETTQHVRIPFGRGICGQAAESQRTLVVNDVAAESNYLACSPHVRSEIVVPINTEGEMVAQLDIDSHVLEAFDDEDRAFAEEIGIIVEEIF